MYWVLTSIKQTTGPIWNHNSSLDSTLGLRHSCCLLSRNLYSWPTSWTALVTSLARGPPPFIMTQSWPWPQHLPDSKGHPRPVQGRQFWLNFTTIYLSKMLSWKSTTTAGPEVYWAYFTIAKEATHFYFKSVILGVPKDNRCEIYWLLLIFTKKKIIFN